jgi:hypothetical protein
MSHKIAQLPHDAEAGTMLRAYMSALQTITGQKNVVAVFPDKLLVMIDDATVAPLLANLVVPVLAQVAGKGSAFQTTD